ncbi:MAG: hypothetical protein LBS18_00440 [Clostridiales bacterium]|jgi:hypothetical protein|nr:hypothetical protein [Clostridiales bacterium]
MKLTVFCAHRPSEDPRIGWVAATARKYFDVTIVGMSADPKKTDDPMMRAYRVEILPLFDRKKQIIDLIRTDKRLLLYECLYRVRCIPILLSAFFSVNKIKEGSKKESTGETQK